MHYEDNIHSNSVKISSSSPEWMVPGLYVKHRENILISKVKIFLGQNTTSQIRDCFQLQIEVQYVSKRIAALIIKSLLIHMLMTLTELK